MNDGLFQQLEDEIRQKEDAIEKMESDIAELKIALRVLRRLQPAAESDSASSGSIATDSIRATPAPVGNEPPKQRDLLGPGTEPEQDLAGSTIVDAARTILLECAEKGMMWLHYKDVAHHAKVRGYQGRSDKALEQSFWSMLNRHSGIFRPVGHGRYALVEFFDEVGPTDE